VLPFAVLISPKTSAIDLPLHLSYLMITVTALISFVEISCGFWLLAPSVIWLENVGAKWWTSLLHLDMLAQITSSF